MNVLTRAGLVALVLVTLGISVPAANAHTILQRGDAGLDVLLWQKMLNQMTTAEHHVPEEIIVEDGIFGPDTERATKRFERGAQFRRDGIVGQRERRRWIGAFITCCGADKPTIGRGSYSTYVGHAQLELNKWLRDSRAEPITIDLLFGPVTEAAVRQYQAAHGLVVDGIVGLQTWGSFFGWPKK